MRWEAACHFSTRQCSFYCNLQRTYEVSRTGLLSLVCPKSPSKLAAELQQGVLQLSSHTSNLTPL